MKEQDESAGRPDDRSPVRAYQDKVGTLTRISDGREFSLGFGSLRVGRQKRADVVVDDRTVSRHHADICYESGRYVVYDHSSNGTWINGQPVAVARPLRHSDTVKFGEVEFRFSLKLFEEAPDRAALSLSRGDTVGRGSTHVMRDGRRRRRRRVALLVVVLIALALIVVTGVALYIFFPGLAERVVGLAPTG